MSKETQILKKTDCSGECQRCNILGIAQRRIGNEGLTEDYNYKSVGYQLQDERCPVGKEMQIQLLNPAKNSKGRLITNPINEWGIKKRLVKNPTDEWHGRNPM